MNILVIGSGGREHALIKSFRKSHRVEQIFASPGREGFSPEAEAVDLNLKKTDQIIEFCKMKNIDFVFIGPEEPLVMGLADELRKANILTIGPGKSAAQLEGSKVQSKNFMNEANIPTAFSVIVSRVTEVKKSLHLFTPPYVLKADGLCAGKGVFICQNEHELIDRAAALFEQKILGEAGRSALLEQFSPGWELSYLVVTNGEKHFTLPLAQDHKRLLAGNEGPNTGGMGTVAPLQIDSSLRKTIENKIVLPTLKQIQKNNWVYRGVIFIGIMVTPEGPSVLEYNVRFGDPETQVILPLIENDTADFFYQLAQGHLSELVINQKNAACVVLAAEGYPDSPQKGQPLTETLNAALKLQTDSKGYVLHAGTKKESSHFVSDGGRVLNCVGVGASIDEAILRAYEIVDSYAGKGFIYRKDIGQYLPS
jgi:phosphoribosylamine--glycine ligase